MKYLKLFVVICSFTNKKKKIRIKIEFLERKKQNLPELNNCHNSALGLRALFFTHPLGDSVGLPRVPPWVHHVETPGEGKEREVRVGDGSQPTVETTDTGENKHLRLKHFLLG